MTDDKLTDSTLAEFDRFLASRGLRRTSERYAILRKVMGSTGHFIVETLHASIEADGYPVSRATVYNTIQLLVEAGIVRRHQFANQPAQYEKTADTLLGSHLHLICRRCGKVKEMKDPQLIASITKSRYRSFTPDYFTLYVYGACAACIRKERKLQKSKKIIENQNKS